MKLPVLRNVTVFLIGFFCYNIALGQDLANISGAVVDSLSNEPIDFASVTLLNQQNNKVVKGGQTDEQGRFSFGDISPGTYTLKASFVGYNGYEQRAIKINSGQTLAVGNIKLSSSSSTLLKEVVIEGTPPAMQMGIDRKIFNPEQSIVSAGGNASELLANVPSLSVDMDGNVGLRGSTNVKILIDGKQSALAGSNINTLLESLPANSIQRIEVMTNPSAKYDPEGQGGIVNIILKKNIRTGFNGMARVGGGSYNNYNGGIDLNYRDTKFNYFGGYDFRKRNNPGSGFNDNRYNDGSRVYNTSDNGRKGNSHTVRLGADFFATEKTTLGLSANMNLRDNIRREDLFYTYYDPTGAIIGTSPRYTNQNEDDTGYEFNFDFKREFEREGEELTANVSYGRSKEDGIQTFEQTATDPSIVIDPNRINDTYEDGKNVNIQVDYVLPFSKEQKLETGYRTTLRYSDEQQLSNTLSSSSGLYEPDYNLTNDFNLDDVVHALYANYQNKLSDKFGYQVGLRAEQAYLNTEYVSYDPSLAPENRSTKGRLDYFRVYPSIYLTQELSEGSSLQLSYTRRVNRPRGWQVNPFLDISDPVNYRQGNPNLKPEDIHSLELAYSKRFGKVNLTSSVYHRITNDVVEMIVDSAAAGTNVTYSTFRNISQNRATGVELISQFTLNKNFDFMANFNGNYQSFSGSEEYGVDANSGFNWDANLTANGRIAKGLTAQLRGNYMAPRVMAQGTSTSMFFADAGLKLSVLEDKGSIMFNVQNIFNKARFGGTRSTAQFNSEFQRNFMKGPRAMLTLSYRFGKRPPDQDRQRKREENSEDFQGGGEMQ
ncbi:TonB-dependent receptor [Olivibacter domesticus]|uniref:Outer membrane receptor proteins, mostly Fe transport n=1 Tax=Olivibacter domesticus TaxID=407022 RepID=A0A1H7VSF3_OLID1|nr:TonB-dependent receptor [Olivibacter domesticus]SEM11755.1 Outer membrane receptor proteins, mostly Fe transport [Olivibacter domesticus]